MSLPVNRKVTRQLALTQIDKKPFRCPFSE
jgi:hypothetical protein